MCKKRHSVKSITLGCRFNFYESEVSKSIINGINPSSNVVIINTCSVTHEAERQSKQAVRKAIRENKDAKIIVTGCAAKTSNEYFENLDGVFKIIQNDKKDDINFYEEIFQNSNNINFNNAFINEENDYLFKNRARVFLQIQNGCDHFCTYCIIPFTRGRSISLPLEEILNRVGYFDDHRFKEIVLSGIDITSYGKDLENIEFADVLESILKKYPSQKRIRISSIDPNGISDKLFDLISNEPRIMPHLHLSIQSGDNEVLKAMKRRHKKEEVIEICNKLQEKRKNIVFGADFIAGFPNETESMFMNTLNLIDKANISLMHIFPYSKRAGTASASYIQLEKSVVLQRAKILRDKANIAKLNLFKQMVSKTTSGIIEKSENGISYGKTDSFIPFEIKKSINPGTVIDMNITGFNEEILSAEVI